MINSLESLKKAHLTLKYEGSGNYTKFQNIINRTYEGVGSMDRYFVYNSLFAFNASELLNVSWEDAGLRWSYIDKINQKRSFLFAHELDKPGSIQARVVTHDIPLVLGSPSRFSSIELEDYAGFEDVVDYSVKVEKPSVVNGVSVECFLFSDFRWTKSEFIFDGNKFFRIKDLFSGFRYFVYISEVNTLFRIIRTEWMFFIAAYLLNISFKDLLQVKGRDIEIPSSIRLPCLILRKLYDESERVNISEKYIFQNIQESTVKDIFCYLKEDW
jgi:hypothetical protein